MSAHRDGDRVHNLVLSPGQHTALRQVAAREGKNRSELLRDFIGAASTGRLVVLSVEEAEWLRAVATAQGVSTDAALRHLLFESWRRHRERAAAE